MHEYEVSTASTVVAAKIHDIVEHPNVIYKNDNSTNSTSTKCAVVHFIRTSQA
jgi:hypothetical protein